MMKSILKTLVYISMSAALVSCGQSESEDVVNESELVSVNTVAINSVIDLSGKKGSVNSAMASKSVSSQVRSSNNSFAETATFEWPVSGEEVKGNLTFKVQVSSDEVMSDVTLLLADSNISYTICDSNCGTELNATIIGLDPKFTGVEPGEIELQVWASVAGGEPVIAGRSFVNWQPYAIPAVTAERLDDTLEVTWLSDTNLDRYNVYISESNELTPQNVLELAGGRQFLALQNTSVSISGIVDSQSYYLLVTGVDSSGESGVSSLVEISPVFVELPEPELLKADSDSFVTDEDTSVDGNVLANDTSGESMSVDVEETTQPVNGTVSIEENGDFTYMPSDNFSGDDSFTYKVVSGDMSAKATVSITVNPINDAPINANDEYKLSETGFVSVEAPGVLGNDLDIDSDSLTSVIEAQPEHGSVELLTDGSFTYQSDSTFVDMDTFSYRVSDGELDAVATVSIKGFDQNTAPQAVNDTYTMLEDGVLTVLTLEAGLLNNDTDPEGGELVIAAKLVAEPKHGQLILETNGTFTYTPKANFFGNDSFTYQVEDAEGLSATATALITIDSVADAPDAVSDIYQMVAESELIISAADGVGKNDANIEGGELTYSISENSGPQNGVITLAEDGSFVYTPTGTFIGTDSFIYTVENEAGLTDTADVSINVSSAFGIPTISAVTTEETSLSANAFDLIGDLDLDAGVTLSIDVNSVSQTQKGVFTISSNGDFEYTPNDDVTGTEAVSFIVLGSDGYQQTVNVNFSITAVNDAPVISNNIELELNEDEADLPRRTVDLTQYVQDVEGDSLTYFVKGDGNSTKGTYTVSESGELVFTLTVNVFGSDMLAFIARDENGAESEGVVSVNITAVNDAPVISNNIELELNEDEVDLSQRTVDLTLHVQDVDDDSLTYFVKGDGNSTKGTYTVSESGELVFYPSANLFGSDTLAFEVHDVNNAVSDGEVSVNITAVNDTPALGNLSFPSVLESLTSGASIGTVTATDVENHQLTFAISGGDSSLFNIDPNTGEITLSGSSLLNFELSQSHIFDVTVTDDGSPNAYATEEVTLGVVNVIEPVLPVENSNFGKSVTGYLDLYNGNSNGKFVDVAQRTGDVYYLGTTQNIDSDLYMRAFTIDGNTQTAFGTNGELELNLGSDEVAKAMVIGSGDLYVLVEKSVGQNIELCIVRLSTIGQLKPYNAEHSGYRCTNEQTLLTGTDITFSSDKVYVVGYKTDGGTVDSLFIKLDENRLDFEDNTPIYKDVGGSNRDDKANAIRNFDGSKLMIVGSTKDANQNWQGYARYVDNSGANEGDFNSGNDKIFNVPGSVGDNELLALGGEDGGDFTAYLGGYTEQTFGTTQALIIAIDDEGALNTAVNSDGFIILDADGGAGTGNSSISALDQAFDTEDFIAVGTITGTNPSKIFTVKAELTNGSLDSNYDSDGIALVSDTNDISAKSMVVDENQRTWIAGDIDDTGPNPFGVVLNPNSSLYSCFPNDAPNCGESGKLVVNGSAKVRQDSIKSLMLLSSGAEAGKYMTVNQSDRNGDSAIVLQRYLSSGQLDTGFGASGSKQVWVGLNPTVNGGIEAANGNLVLYGSAEVEGAQVGFIGIFDQNGQPVSTFGNNGVFVADGMTEFNSSVILDIALDGTDKFVAIGNGDDGGTDKPFVLKVTPTGKLDTDNDSYDSSIEEFTSDGYIIGSASQNYTAVAIDGNRNIFVGGVIGFTSADFWVAKLNSSGIVDATFGSSGARQVTDTNTDDVVSDILLDTANNIYLIGKASSGFEQTRVAKLDTNGDLVTSFGAGGLRNIDNIKNSGSDSGSISGALDATGRLLLVGYGDDNTSQKGGIIRLDTNGDLDSMFGVIDNGNGTGKWIADNCAGEQSFTALVLNTDEQIVVTNQCEISGNKDVAISQFNFYEEGVEP